MTKNDFIYISWFTATELEATGANINDIDFFTVKALDEARIILDEQINPLLNGITSGKHSSSTHKDGKAIDFTCEADPLKIILTLASVGFTGIGVYVNEFGFRSYHADTGKGLRTWKGTKAEDGTWRYTKLELNI